jgi:hypothetical protein
LLLLNISILRSDRINMVPIVWKIKVQWHTFWLSGLWYSLIEMFVPHKISFFCFSLVHWHDSNFNRARSRKHISWTFFFCSSSVSSLVHHYRVCVLQNIHRWNGIQPVHMLVITRENESTKSENESKKCVKSHWLTEKKKGKNDDDNDLLVERKEDRVVYICIWTAHFSHLFFMHWCKRGWDVYVFADN